MDYPASYDSRIRDLEVQLRQAMDLIDGLLLRREANWIPGAKSLTRVVKLDADVSAGDTVSVTEILRDSSGVQSYGETFTAREALINAADTIEAGTKAMVTEVDGQWIIHSPFCETSDTLP